jgi:Flp pilus assembly protein TadG
MIKRIISKRNRPGIFRSQEGSAAIEFALLAIPFFMIIFAIFETFFALIGEQVISDATDTMARRLRTGEISKNITQEEFRKQFCAEASVIITCSADEISKPQKLYIDLRSFAKFADIPTSVPLVTHGSGRDIDVSKLGFAPGGAGTINMLRVYYRWPVITDLVRPFLTNITPADGTMPRHFLIVSTDAFMSEAY